MVTIMMSTKFQIPAGIENLMTEALLQNGPGYPMRHASCALADKPRQLQEADGPQPGECSGCEHGAGELYPWGSAGLICLNCLDTHLDLLALAYAEGRDLDAEDDEQDPEPESYFGYAGDGVIAGND